MGERGPGLRSHRAASQDRPDAFGETFVLDCELVIGFPVAPRSGNRHVYAWETREWNGRIIAETESKGAAVARGRSLIVSMFFLWGLGAPGALIQMVLKMPDLGFGVAKASDCNRAAGAAAGRVSRTR